MAILQVAGQPRGARRAITLADQKLGRVPAFVAGDIEADKVTDRLDILFQAVKLFGLFAWCRAAVAGTDRVDKDEIADSQQSVFIVGQPVGGRLRGIHITADHPLWPKQPQVHPDRRGTWPTVKGDDQGSCADIGHVVLRVGNEEDRGACLARFIFDQQGAGGCRVV